MTRTKGKGRNGGNRSTQTAHNQQVIASLDQINAEIDKARDLTNHSFTRHIRKSERIKLLPNHLKTIGVTQLLYWLKRDLLGVR